MRKRFNKLWNSSKGWFLHKVWARIRTRKELSLTFLILVVAVSVCTMLWSWMCNNPEATAGFAMCLVLAIGLYFAYRQLKLMYENNLLMKTTEQAKLITDMHNYWDSQIMAEGRKAIWETVEGKKTKKSANALRKELERSKEKDFDRWLRLTRVANFFELMGNLARDKAIDLRIVAGSFRTNITSYYDVYEAFIKRRRPEEPPIYKYFEWLKEEIQKVKM